MTIPKQSDKEDIISIILDLNKPYRILKSNYNHIKVREKLNRFDGNAGTGIFARLVVSIIAI